MALRFLDVHLYRSTLNILAEGAAQAVQAAAEAGGGVLRCFPSFVGRKFCLPGKNLELVDEDYFPEGPGRLGDRRTVERQRHPGRYRQRDPRRGAVPLPSPRRLPDPDGCRRSRGAGLHGGADVPDPGRHGVLQQGVRQPVPSRPPQHPWKPEAYNFNAWRNKRYKQRLPHVGRAAELRSPRRCWLKAVRDFIAGKDNHIRSHARNLLVRMGTGFFTPTRILHGPAAVNTEEPQRDRDDFRFYQSHVLCPDGEVFLGQELLFRHLPEGLDGEDAGAAAGLRHRPAAQPGSRSSSRSTCCGRSWTRR